MVILLSLSLFSACDLFSFERTACTTNEDCDKAFGKGSICISSATQNTDSTEDTEQGYCSTCETNEDCQDAYGNGAMCAARTAREALFDFEEEPKYCEVELTPDVRCSESIPADIWNDWESYSDAVIIGQMFKGKDDRSKTTATKLAIEQIQEIQGDDERLFVSVLCNYSTASDAGFDDGLSETAVVKAIADHLVDDFGANVIIGPSNSSASLTAIEHLDGRAVLISPSATSEDLSNRQQANAENDEAPMFWRTVPSDKYQSAVLIQLIKQKEQQAKDAAEATGNVHTTKIGVLYTDEVYGLGILEALEEALGDELVEGFKFDEETTLETLESIIQGAENTAFEDVTSILSVVSGVDDLKTVINIILDHNSSSSKDASLLYFFTDSAARSEVFTTNIRQKISDNPEIIERIWGTRPAILEDASHFSNFNSDFEKRFTEALGETYDPTSPYKYDAKNNIFAAFSYDAMWLGILGSLWAQTNGNETAEGISLGMSSFTALGRQTPLRSTEWGFFKEEFLEERALNIQGCSGDLDFNPTTKRIEAKIEIWSIDENSQQIIADECSFSLGDQRQGDADFIGSLVCEELVIETEE